MILFAKSPQWSPPVMGGMTAGDHVRYAVHDLAAMEPARNGRDDVGPVRRPPAGQDAAMEPARNGRDDPGGRLPAAAGRAAAMEPARNGRDDREGHRPAVAGPGAAMEPARNGRDDRAPFRGALASASRPQWSPPVMGGMTRAAPSRRYVRAAAAMEPARNGRDDATRRGRTPRGHVRRNGARP